MTAHQTPHPWDSPGKNTGVGCHFLLQCMKVKTEIEVAQSCPTLRDTTDGSLPGSSIHGIFQARVLEGGAIAFSALAAYSEPKKGFPGGLVAKNLPASAGYSSSIPGLRRSPGVGNSNPLQYSCLGNPMDRGAWWAVIHGVTKSQTRLHN